MNGMNWVFALTIGSVAYSALLSKADAAVVSGIDFQVTDQGTEIVITSDQPLEFKKQENLLDRQLVIDLPGVELGSTAERKLDTSSFESPVTLVSPYSVNSAEGPAARVVVQLRDMSDSKITQVGNKLTVLIPGGTSREVSQEEPNTQNEANTEGGVSDDPVADLEMPSVPSVEDLPPAKIQDSKPNQSATSGSKSALDTFVESQDTQKFIGKPITIQVRNANMVDVFRLIAETSGFNIVVGEDVKGTVTLSLKDVPWDQALDLILKSQQLGAERNGSILRITTLDSLTAEKQKEIAAKAAVAASAPRVTRVFPISYANPADLVTLLTAFGSKETSGPSTSSTVVQIDKRTNSIIVRDTMESIERMRKLIELLDTQTPQIMIEAKIVEATEAFSKSLSGGIGGQRVTNNIGFGATSMMSTVDPPFGASGIETGGAIALQFLRNDFGLSTFLNFQEEQSNIKVVSSPKLVVLDRETAKILSTEPVAFNNSSQGLGGVTLTQREILQAEISLDVEPTVTNDGSVLMKVSVKRDQPDRATSTVKNRSIDTKVLVESGSTVVIGGLYVTQELETESGVPLLRKIPLIGWLFGSEGTTTNRQELFIFITPRIINEKAAGFSTAQTSNSFRPELPELKLATRWPGVGPTE